jgi:peptidoglycan/xylan/chitin deacetylase (PgdA/CDA1 family)
MTIFAAYYKWRVPPLVIASTFFTLTAVTIAVIFPQILSLAVTAVSVNILVLTFAGLWPRCSLVGSNWTSLPATSVEHQEIAITIDDGPNPVITPLVLEVLDKYQAKATFFCIGEKAARYPDLCREICARGHSVENHSMYHKYHFSLLMPPACFSEINTAQETLFTITRKRPEFFRAPAGLRNPLLDAVLFRLGMQLVSWTRRGFDTVERDPAVVLNKLITGLKAGDILLLHDDNAALTAAGKPVILEVLPGLLEAVIALNLQTVTLEESKARHEKVATSA